MNEAIFTQLQKEMEGSVAALRKELGRVRTGRASTAVLEGVLVDYYGATTPLNQLATLSAPEPRLTPANDGKIIRVPIPQLTEERRKDLVKHVKKTGEEFRVSMRNHRRLAIEHLKESEKKKEITADEIKHGQDRVQKITDDYIARVDKVLKTKEEEIMEV
jgi:ribosome recycling factor